MRNKISVVILITVLAFSMSSCKSSKTAVLSMNGTDLFEYPEVDKKPMYKGMEPVQAFGELVVKNIKYPAEALEKGISGNVFVSFIIEKNGSISNVKIIRGADPLLDAEVLRVTEMLYKTKWTPGEKNGKKVRVSSNHPIPFRLNK